MIQRETGHVSAPTITTPPQRPTPCTADTQPQPPAQTPPHSMDLRHRCQKRDLGVGGTGLERLLRITKDLEKNVINSTVWREEECVVHTVCSETRRFQESNTWNANLGTGCLKLVSAVRRPSPRLQSVLSPCRRSAPAHVLRAAPGSHPPLGSPIECEQQWVQL